MKKLLSISALAAAAAIAYAGTANAADMPVKALPPPPPVYSWTGVYIGVSEGWQWQHSDWDYQLHVAGAPNQTFGADQGSGIFGAHVGVQWQWSSIVIGAEYNRLNNNSDPESWTSHSCPVTTLNCKVLGHDFNLAGARLGWAGTGIIPFTSNWLLYATGGWAQGTVQTRVESTTSPFTGTGEDSLVKQDGWYAGVGLDLLLAKGSLVDWIGGIEYDHIDLGTSFHCVVAGCAPSVLNRNVGFTDDIIRFRTSLKFHP
jgi:outer membrane immunogenic protein